jgi:hypothetical protein
VAPPDDRAFIVITKAARVVKGLPVESSIRSFVCAVVLWWGLSCQRLASSRNWRSSLLSCRVVLAATPTRLLDFIREIASRLRFTLGTPLEVRFPATRMRMTIIFSRLWRNTNISSRNTWCAARSGDGFRTAVTSSCRGDGQSGDRVFSDGDGVCAVHGAGDQDGGALSGELWSGAARPLSRGFERNLYVRRSILEFVGKGELLQIENLAVMLRN